MTRILASMTLFVGSLICVGLTAIWYTTQDTVADNITCRPSAPELLDDGPKILFWGNSLAFDHNWRLTGWTAINCARQGLTATASLPLLKHLPAADTSAVVLVFGTVELLRNSVDVSEFQQALSISLEELKRSYPNAKVLIIGVPEGSAETWTYGRHQDLAAINAILRKLPDTTFLDTTSILSNVAGRYQTYDGAHLTFHAYTLIEAGILEVLKTSN